MRIEQVAIPLIRAVVSRPKLADQLFKRDKWGNPFGDQANADPYPMLEAMRADGAITYRAMYQQWFVSGYDEARAILSSDAMGTSAQVDTLLDVRPFSQMSEQAKTFFSLWLLLVDPPDHSRLRRLVSRAFTPARVRDLQPDIEQLADRLIDDMADQASPDVIKGLCEPLPVAVIAQMMGLPEERWSWARETTEIGVQLLNPFASFDPDEISATVADMHEVWGRLADERLTHPQNDLVSALVAAEDGGSKLSRDELIAMIGFIMGAGHETTTNLLAMSILHLARNPKQRELVRSTPTLWPNAIEELVRYDTSVRVSPRSALREVDIDGVTIPAGSNVLVQISAANRDPRRYDHPNELLLDRKDPSPLSFGHGIHHCLGASLARMELGSALPRFIDAFGDYTIDEASIKWKQSPTLRGPSALRVDRSSASGT